ncbi:MAG TPA: TPM domain-containing protein [Pyrinomonadaceae bacterium]|jgi:uncharacterized protein
MNSTPSFAKISFLLAAFFCMASLNVFSQEFSINESPLGAPTSPVMDYAGVLDAATKQSLEKRLIDFRDKTNPRVELAVVVVKTTGDRPIFDYSLAVARGWKIGSKEGDNPSALLFIATDDRKYITQVSRDLEDELPDGVVGQLQRKNLVPAFKQGDYAKGITDTIEAYIRTIESKQTGGVAPAVNETPKTGRTRGGRTTGGIGGICCLVIAFFIIMAIFSRSSRGGGGGNDRWRGGGFGGGGSVLPWVIGSVIANSIGNSSGSSSSSSDWGGSSGGGDSWGGFGGGGDFGGGGAGGDW